MSSPELYNFQKEAVADLLSAKNSKRICILPTGAGKTAVMFNWLKNTYKSKIVIITTATKAKSGDMEKEAKLWCGEDWLNSRASFEVVSWHKAKKWADENLSELRYSFNYAIAFDEIQKCKGYTSGMGRAFQRICRATDCWTGYTATPGDKWIDLMPYFVATKKIINKTAFMKEHAIVQTYKGYPEIINYKNEDALMEVWDSITTIPNAEQMFKELPSETHKVVEFKKPASYDKIIKERKYIEKTDTHDKDDLIDTVMGLCHYLRQKCFTKEKQEWLKDFIEGLGDNCVFFCNYVEEEEILCDIAEKALPDGARVWRIDGKHHEVPTPETIGKYDIVVAHYASGGEALNLQFMHYWVAVSPNYSLSSSVQARGRIKRIGQKFPMHFYYLRTNGTIETEIYQCLKAKSDFSEKTWQADHELDDMKLS